MGSNTDLKQTTDELEELTARLQDALLGHGDNNMKATDLELQTKDSQNADQQSDIMSKVSARSNSMLLLDELNDEDPEQPLMPWTLFESRRKSKRLSSFKTSDLSSKTSESPRNTGKMQRPPQEKAAPGNGGDCCTACIVF